MRGMNRGLYPQSPSATFAQDFAGGLAVGQSVGNTISGIGHQARLKSISDAVNKAGGDISAIDSSLYSDPEGMVALGGFLDQYTTTQEGLLKAKDAHSKVAEQQFQTLSNGLQYLEQNQGNPQALTAGIEQLSRHLNLPYNLSLIHILPRRDGLCAFRHAAEPAPAGDAASRTVRRGLHAAPPK